MTPAIAATHAAAALLAAGVAGRGAGRRQPHPATDGGRAMSDEPTERDVTPLLTVEERRAILSARAMTPLTLLMVVETVKAEARREGAAEAHGIRFRVGTACDGYASLTAADVPDGIFDEEDYYLGAQHAAEGIRAVLRDTP